MTAALLLCLAATGQSCRTNYYPTSYNNYQYQTYVPVAVPVTFYVAGTDEKVELLTKIAAQQNQLITQQTAQLQLMQAQAKATATASLSPAERAGRAVIENACVSCHSGAKPKGDLSLAGALSNAKLAMAVERAAVERSMPPGKPLDEDGAKALQSWLDERRGTAAAQSTVARTAPVQSLTGP